MKLTSISNNPLLPQFGVCCHSSLYLKALQKTYIHVYHLINPCFSLFSSCCIELITNSHYNSVIKVFRFYLHHIKLITGVGLYILFVFCKVDYKLSQVNFYHFGLRCIWWITSSVGFPFFIICIRIVFSITDFLLILLGYIGVS